MGSGATWNAHLCCVSTLIEVVTVFTWLVTLIDMQRELISARRQGKGSGRISHVLRLSASHFIITYLRSWSVHIGVTGSNLICQHLVSSPIQELIYTAPLYLLQVESMLSTSVCLVEEEARFLTIRRICSNADDDLATDLNQLWSHYSRLGRTGDITEEGSKSLFKMNVIKCNVRVLYSSLPLSDNLLPISGSYKEKKDTSC